MITVAQIERLFCQGANPGMLILCRLILKHSSVDPAQILPSLQDLFLSLFSQQKEECLGSLSNAGDLGSHTSASFNVGEIIKFLLVFSLSPVPEAFNYFHFYKDSPVDFLSRLPHTSHNSRTSPKKANHLKINLPLRQNYPLVFASHSDFHLLSTYA